MPATHGESGREAPAEPVVTRRNGIAAVLATLALLALAPGLLLPFIRFASLFETQSLSIVGTVTHLWHDGKVLLALVILVFSICFPLAKLAMILCSVLSFVPVSGELRERLHRVAERTARWSMLDVFVLALVVVVLEVKGVMDVDLQVGAYAFTAAVIFSGISGMFVVIPDGGDDQEGEMPAPTRSTSRSRTLLVLLLLGVLGTSGGIVLWQTAGGGTVQAVVLRHKPGLDLDRLKRVVDDPDYYLDIQTPGKSHKTATREEPIGNGLRFTLEEPILLDEVETITVMDENANVDIAGRRIGLPDTKLDRIEIGKAREVTGDRFVVTLEGPASTGKLAGCLLMAVFGIAFVVGLLMFVAGKVVGSRRSSPRSRTDPEESR